MNSAHTTECQFHFIVPFKGQINLCFYKEKIKDQLSWASMHICYLSVQIQFCVFGRDSAIFSLLPHFLICHCCDITHWLVNILPLNEQLQFY